MVKIDELRYGNLIIDGDNDIIEVLSDDFERVLFSPEQYNPITLTSQLLEKCGFNRLPEEGVNDQVYQNAHGYQILMQQDGSTEFHFPSLYVGRIELTSLHHLQNVYYFLATEELEVNL